MKTIGFLALGILAFCIGFFGVSYWGKMEKEEEGDFVRLRGEWFYQQRAFGLGYIPAGARELALQQAQQKMPVYGFAKRNGSVGAWAPIGPNNVAGRLNSIAISPSNPNTIYISAADGGIWKTTDGGSSWTPLTDNLETMASGLVGYNPKTSSLYYASGEANNSLDSYYGTGMFKSTDGGTTWAKLTNFPVIGTGTATYYSTSALVVDTVKNRVWIGLLQRQGTNAGNFGTFNGKLYMSTDGGSSFTAMAAPIQFPFISDFVIDPAHPDTGYAAVGYLGGDLTSSGFSTQGIYKTTNAGTTWTALTSGLPTAANMGRINLAICKTIPNVLFASIVVPTSLTNGGKLDGIYKTVDGGATWTKVYTPTYSGTLADNWLSTQGWYDNIIAVHPTDTSIVYAGGVNLMKSATGGRTWTTIADWTVNASGNVNSPHADHHAFAFHPTNPLTIFNGNDGGLFRSTDGGISWNHLNTGVFTTQFHSLALNPQNPDKSHGGTQDNGTLKYAGSSAWTKIFGGDGGQVAVDAAAPETLYTEYVYLDMQRSFNGGTTFTEIITGIPTSSSGPTSGERIAFYAPYDVSRSAPATMYAGTYRMWKSVNRGDTWTSNSGDLTGGTATVSAIAIAPSDPNHVYAGTSDGWLWSTTNGGTTWDTTQTYPLASKRFVKDFAVNATNTSLAYVAFSGYKISHVFKTTNHGATWSNASTGLPDIPVNAVTFHPNVSTTLFIGTDIGCFVTTDGGSSWATLGTGLPNVVVDDIAVAADGTYIRAATHGRSIWQLVDVPSDVSESPFNLVSSYALYQNYPNPFNPSTEIRFDLQRSEHVTLKIYDAAGREVAMLLNDQLNAGRHSVRWDGRNSARQPVASGSYYYRLRTESFSKTNKMVLVK